MHEGYLDGDIDVTVEGGKQGLRVDQVGGAEILGELAVDRSQTVERLVLGFALRLTEPGQTDGGTQLEGERGLTLRDVERLVKTGLGVDRGARA